MLVRRMVVERSLAKLAVIAAFGVFDPACKPRDGQLPGQSDVEEPGPGEAPIEREHACRSVVSEGTTLFASKDAGWGIVLPGDAWQLTCADAMTAKGKMASDRGESLMMTVTRIPNPPAKELLHLDAIYQRAQAALPGAGAAAGRPKVIVARAAVQAPERSVLVYQVHAAEFEQAGLKSFHGWSVLQTRFGATYECHLSATVRKDLDWPELLAKHLATCLPMSER
jgi:hypothetical protein